MTSLVAAGVIVGLGFIAAAVKFTAVKPDLMGLLDVGRVQFGALHLAEWLLVPAACLALFWAVPSAKKWSMFSLAIFLVQAVAIQPPLHARMVARLAGENVGDSNLHVVYVVVSMLLTAGLVAQSVISMVSLAEQCEPESRSESPVKNSNESLVRS